MHIALLDENIADRKQFERLIDREADKRKDINGVHYTDAYGEGSNLFPRRMSYDLFFLDGLDSETGAYEFAEKLINNGVSVPIVLCSKIENYEMILRQKYDIPANILFLKKPVLKADLSAIMDKAEELHSKREHKIELRDSKDTFYVSADEIMYFKDCGLHVDVCLKDGRIISALDSISYLTSAVADNIFFAAVCKALIINVTYVEKLSLLHLKMANGYSTIVSLMGHYTIKNAMTLVKKEKGEFNNDN